MSDANPNKNFAVQEQELRNLIKQYHLDHISEQLLRTATTALRLIKMPSGELGVECSRFGGLPDVPADFSWPTRKGRPLGFLGQIDCAAVNKIYPGRPLPPDGLFYFFYDMYNVQDQPWGFDPKDKGGWMVCHVSGSQLAPATLPAGMDSKMLLPVFSMTYHLFLSIPSYNSLAFQSLQLPKTDAETYFDLEEAVANSITPGQPKHQLFGHSDNIQNDMQLECQLVSNGLDRGDASGYKDPRRRLLEAGAHNWQLLLQFDSDDDLDVMWGDVGMVYFWIRRTDLQELNFNQIWTILQCG